MSNTAEFVRSLSGFRGEAALYKLSPVMAGVEPGDMFQFVVVSAAVVMFSGPETYIFGADSEGNVLEWAELEGSYRGGLDHERALRGAGYTLVRAAPASAAKEEPSAFRLSPAQELLLRSFGATDQLLNLRDADNEGTLTFLRLNDGISVSSYSLPEEGMSIISLEEKEIFELRDFLNKHYPA